MEMLAQEVVVIVTINKKTPIHLSELVSFY